MIFYDILTDIFCYLTADNLKALTLLLTLCAPRLYKVIFQKAWLLTPSGRQEIQSMKALSCVCVCKCSPQPTPTLN